MKLSRIKKLIFLHLQHLPMKSRGGDQRFVNGGVNIKCPKKTFIGEDVIFDTNYPEDIVIEEGVRLTVGVRIVTHFMNRRQAVMTAVKCMLQGAYIGMGTMVVKPVTIGEGAIVAPGQ